MCKAVTKIHVSNSGTKTLHCTNSDCTAKNVQKFSRFVSKNAMDIEGLSVQTILRFINEGFIKEYADIYRLREHFDTIRELDGFGDKSCENLDNAIEKSRDIHPVNLIFALCIPMIGLDAAKKIINTVGFDVFMDRMKAGIGFEDIDGIGGEKSNSILQWYMNVNNQRVLENLLSVIRVQKVEKVDTENGRCVGMTFVITGDVHHFKNRDEFKAYVEAEGGKVAGSVSGKTNYLVNNDVESTSSKNKKAKSLGVPIISEDTFIEMFGGQNAN